MGSNLATIVRRLHPARSRNQASALKLASAAPEAEIDRRSRPAVAPVLAREPDPSRASIARHAQRRRAPRLLESTIKYVVHASFDDPAMTAKILGPLPGSSRSLKALRTSQAAESLHTRAGQNRAERLLTHDQETHLVRKLNFLKYRAAKLCAKLDPHDVFAPEIDRVARLLHDASATQNRIIRSYMPLVVSIVKSWIRPGQDFFELLSEATLAMMRAMECFDFARGRRFSTYVTWAVANDFARIIPKERNRRHRFKTGRDGLLRLVSDHRGGFLEAEDRDQDREEIHSLLGRLSQREQVIINCRFGLTGDERTLEEIGHELGITKERVRQIESRALCKLRRVALAREHNPAGRCLETARP
jgi:RNA polymerase primary sigma factor